MAATPADAAEEADVIISMVSDTPDVEQVLLGQRGVIETARKGATVIDMSTISPEATRQIAKRFSGEGVNFLDAPVSGGDVGAINATLSIMVGGEPAVFDGMLPVLKTMGSKVTLIGPVGSGQVCKACNQVLVVANLMGVCEALGLADVNDIEPKTPNLCAVRRCCAKLAAGKSRAQNCRPGF